MTTRTVSALFDNYADAAEAVRKVEAAGVSHDMISIVSNDSTNNASYADKPYSTSGTTSNANDDDHKGGTGSGATLGTVVGGGAGLLAGLGLLAIPGLGPVVAGGWLISTLLGAGIGAGVGAAAGGLTDALTNEGISHEDAHAYSEGVRRGGTLVTIRAEESMVDRVVDILDDEGTVNMDERETSWRSEGYAGYQPSTSSTSTTGYGTTGTGMGATAGGIAAGIGAAAGRAADAVGDALTPDRTTTSTSAYASGTTGTGMGATGMGTERTSTTSERDEAIPIVEENIAIGKREVNRGRVRVHTRVIETPVNEQVSLRNEQVHVERVAVDRPVTATDAMFQDRTIEATERAEEAVVSKTARVTGEVRLAKEATERVETVTDTVRRTEVEVDDQTGITGTTRDTTIKGR